jgi:hypothetical protein
MSPASPDASSPASGPPPGCEVVRTYLELTERDALRPADFPDADALRVTARAPCTVAEYRALYDAVGRRTTGATGSPGPTSGWPSGSRGRRSPCACSSDAGR